MKTNTKKAKRGGYLTRTQAIRYLQVTLADFRRLCILKGIYPREITSRKKKQKLTKGSTRPITAYYRKDIQYLMHEPLLQKFRDHKVFAKKLNKAMGRRDIDDAKRIDENRPRYTLDHIIKERYPTFMDALGDIDDALCMIYLFSLMPASDAISYRISQDAQKLADHWSAFIAREGALRKVFVSIKGVYYEANVKGQDIRWLVPFKFPQNTPTDVDFKIMLTFLEFYTTLIHFVLYKLYTEQGLVYPPNINEKKLKGVGGLSTYMLESRQSAALPAVEVSESNNGKTARTINVQERDLDEDEEDDEGEDEDEKAAALDEFEEDGEDGDQLLQPTNKSESQLFSKFTFFVGREVALDILEFIILSFGGKVISEARIDELVDNEDENMSNKTPELDLKKVTHHICDRPAISGKVPGRVYVQPQWVFDSVNKGEFVSASLYAPGESLPPHLSPWGDRGTYDPQQAPGIAENDSDSDEEEDVEEAEEAEVEIDEEEDAEAAAEAETQKELELEAAGVKYSEAPQAKKRKAKAMTTEQEEKELRKIMMTSKQRKLYAKMQHSNDKKAAREEALNKKRRKIEKLKGKLSK